MGILLPTCGKPFQEPVVYSAGECWDLFAVRFGLKDASVEVRPVLLAVATPGHHQSRTVYTVLRAWGQEQPWGVETVSQIAKEDREDCLWAVVRFHRTPGDNRDPLTAVTAWARVAGPDWPPDTATVTVLVRYEERYT